MKFPLAPTAGLATSILLCALLLAIAPQLSTATTAINDKSALQAALGEWCTNTTTAEAKYGGVIADWDVTKVTDMSALFKDWEASKEVSCKTTFNEPLTNWATGQVTTMR